MFTTEVESPLKLKWGGNWEDNEFLEDGEEGDEEEEEVGVYEEEEMDEEEE